MPESTSRSWYLDPVAARHKGAANRELLQRWTPEARPLRVLKTDLFEEANGEDRVLTEIFPGAVTRVGIDQDAATVGRAQGRSGGAIDAVVADLRALPFRDGAFDFVMSTSTLDHFDERRSFVQSIEETVRIIAPGGDLIVTLDNPLNPLYWPLRLVCGWVTSFQLGYTETLRAFCRDLRRVGFEIRETDYLVHNPRMFSTLLFLLIRKIGGARANQLISVCLGLFDRLGRLPTRSLTSCFSAVHARRT